MSIFESGASLRPTTMLLALLLSAPLAADDDGHCYLTPWTPGTPGNDSQVGDVVTMDATTAVVAATGRNEVYVYELLGSTWSHAQTIPTPSASPLSFGRAIGLDGDLLAIGDPNDSTTGGSAGAVFLYERVGGSWILQESFYGAENEVFGRSVDVHDGSQKRVAIGAPGAMGTAGRVYLLLEQPGGWYAVDEITAAGNDEFGYTLDMDEATLVVGDHSDDELAQNAGAVFHYTVHNAGATFLDKIVAPDGSSGDAFGFSISVEHLTRLAVGAYRDDEAGTNSGSVYLFDYDSLPIPPFGAFADSIKILPSNPVSR